MGSALGVRKVAAGRLGLTLDQYDAHITVGEKWCGRCREWHLRTAFGADRDRSDGLMSYCLQSRVVSISKPGTRERRLRAADGLAWCRGCQTWLATDLVSQGACRDHRNTYGREYYARNVSKIKPRKQARTRGLDIIPDWWTEQQFEEFGGLCAYGCGRTACTLDHIWPVARRGRSEPSNLVPACKPCNSSKRDRNPAPWVARFAAAFPYHYEALVALTYEHASSLDMDEVAA